MELYIRYFAIFTWMLFWKATTCYSVQMFQQNSYRVARYNRWLRSTGEWHSRPNMVSALGAVVLLLTEHWSVMLILGLWMLIIALAEFSIKYKIKLAYTMRVRRLLLTRFLITALAVALVEFYAPRHLLSVLLIMSLDYWTIVANTINMPLESAITRWYYNDAKRMLRSMSRLKIIGITGSFGKTSTKHYLHRILSERYNVLMTPGNFNTTLGVVRTIREHLKPHHEIFIVEMGAKQRGDIKEICDLVSPEMGIVTSVGEMHLETFGTVEGVARTKFELLEALPEGGFGIVNIDSEAAAAHLKGFARNVATYGMESVAAEYRATDVRYATSETSFAVRHGEHVEQGYVTHLLGRGNILNLTAAIAVAEQLGVTTAEIKRAVRQIEQVEHRLSMRSVGGVTILDDAYNSNPTGAKMALEVLSAFDTSGARYVVTPGFVEMGARQYDNNRGFGCDIAHAEVDGVYVVNEVNRKALCDGLEAGGYDGGKVSCVASFQEAMSELQPRLKVGDVVLYENDLPDSFK